MAAVAYFSRRLGFTQLVSMGVHVGHSLVNSSIYAAWLVYGYRAGVCLINLQRFGGMLRLGFQVLDYIVSLGRPLWFVNQDKAFARYVGYYAFQCGEFSSAALWIRGMLSNFKVVGAFAKHHEQATAFANNRKQRLLDKAFTQWFLTRYTWPGMVFVSSISANYGVVNEALQSGVPCMGIADSDAMVQGCTIAVPGNDDALDSVVFYHELLAEYILYRKFSKVYLWFLHVRRAKRLLSFYDWLVLKKKNKSSLDLGFFFSSHLKVRLPFAQLAINFLLGQGTWSRVVEEQLQVFRGASLFSVREALDRLEQGATKYHYLFNYFFFSRVWRRRGRLLFSKKVRRKWRLRHRRSMVVWLRKNLQWKTLRFARKFRYLRRLYGLRRGRLGARRHVRRFLHYYLLLYFFYLKTFKKVKASYRRWRRKPFRMVSRRPLRSEFRLYWRYYRKYFRNRKHYEATLRLGTQRQRRKLWGGHFGLFQVLFQVFHEPWLEERIQLQREWYQNQRHGHENQRHGHENRRHGHPHWWHKGKDASGLSTKSARGAQPKQHRRHYTKNDTKKNTKSNFQKNTKHNPRTNKPWHKPQHRRRHSWVHLSFGRWRGFYKKAIELFYHSPEHREKHFLGIVYPRDPYDRAHYLRRRAAKLVHGHQRIESTGRKLLQRASAFFRLGRFLSALRKEMLRMVFYGFFHPRVGTSGASFFDVTGALARAVAFRQGPRLSHRRRRPRALLTKFYGSALRSLSLGFWGRRRPFFIGHIPFGPGSQAFRHQQAAYDFSLAALPGGSLWRMPLDVQRWKSRSPSQGKSLIVGSLEQPQYTLRLRRFLRRRFRASNRWSWGRRKKRAPFLAATRRDLGNRQGFRKDYGQGVQKGYRQGFRKDYGQGFRKDYGQGVQKDYRQKEKGRFVKI